MSVFGEEFDADEFYFLFGVFVFFVGEFVECLVDVVVVCLAEVVVDVLHVVVVHHLVYVIVKVEFCATVHDAVYFVEEFAQGEAFGLGYFVEVHLAVHCEDDADLFGTLVDEGTDAEILEAVYLVLFAVACYELTELCAIALASSRLLLTSAR